MILLGKLSLGAIMIALTVVVHAFVSDYVLRFLNSHKNIYAIHKTQKLWVLVISVFLIGAALMIEIWMWALLFYGLEREFFGNIETALYFATTTFTTVGFGDIVLPPEWRILSGSTAINGMLLFGWSAAFIFEIMTQLYAGTKKS